MDYDDHDWREHDDPTDWGIYVNDDELLLAQDSGDFNRATSNVLNAQYPRVDSNKAPDATKVRVNFWSGPKADMEKETDGFWTFTTPPMAPVSTTTR